MQTPVWGLCFPFVLLCIFKISRQDLIFLRLAWCFLCKRKHPWASEPPASTSQVLESQRLYRGPVSTDTWRNLKLARFSKSNFRMPVWMRIFGEPWVVGVAWIVCGAWRMKVGSPGNAGKGRSSREPLMQRMEVWTEWILFWVSDINVYGSLPSLIGGWDKPKAWRAAGSEAEQKIGLFWRALLLGCSGEESPMLPPIGDWEQGRLLRIPLIHLPALGSGCFILIFFLMWVLRIWTWVPKMVKQALYLQSTQYLLFLPFWGRPQSHSNPFASAS